MREEVLHYLWKQKKIAFSGLTTASGESLYIFDFGQYNPNSGPDFLSAKIRIGEQIWIGNVEIHTQSSHWYVHKHENNPAFSNIILHVVWQHDVEIFSSHEQKIPVLELKNQVDESLIRHCEALLSFPKKFINCENDFKQINDSISEDWNTNLFLQRLKEKTQRIEILHKSCNSDWEKLLFLLLLKNFGGIVNGEAFLQMGKTLDFSIIRKEKHYPLHLEALFFGQLQMLSDDVHDAYFLEIKKEYAYLKLKYALNDSVVGVRFSKLRPQGFPTLRLSQLGQLYEKNEGLFSRFIHTKTFDEFKTLLAVIASEYWNNHYTFGKESGKSTKKISQELIRLIWINTLLPLQYYYSQNQGYDISEQLKNRIKELPKEKNHIITAFEKIGAKVTSAFDTQVILQQYNSYCIKNRCLECEIGNKILRNNNP